MWNDLRVNLTNNKKSDGALPRKANLLARFWRGSGVALAWLWRGSGMALAWLWPGALSWFWRCSGTALARLSHGTGGTGRFTATSFMRTSACAVWAHCLHGTGLAPTAPLDSVEVRGLTDVVLASRAISDSPHTCLRQLLASRLTKHGQESHWIF